MDTSIFGGCFDKEFAEESLRLLDSIASGKYKVLISDLVINELRDAPDYIQNIFQRIPIQSFERVIFTKEVEKLSEGYIKAGILTLKSETDAGHVACATIYQADAIVSWNFKHIVNLEKMRLYNEVNLKKGYALLSIVTPREVLGRD